MKNTFGPNAAMQTNEFGRSYKCVSKYQTSHDVFYFAVAFIIFWTISLPFFLLRPEQLVILRPLGRFHPRLNNMFLTDTVFLRSYRP